MDVKSPRKKQSHDGSVRHMSIDDDKTFNQFHKKYGLPPDHSPGNVHWIPTRRRAQSLAFDQQDQQGRTGRRGSLLQQKETAMLGQSYSHRVLSLRQTLAMMGQSPPGMMKNGVKISKGIDGPGSLKKVNLRRSLSRKKMMLLEDLGIIAEDTDSDGGLMSNRGHVSDSDSSVGLGASKRSIHLRQRKKRVRDFELLVVWYL